MPTRAVFYEIPRCLDVLLALILLLENGDLPVRLVNSLRVKHDSIAMQDLFEAVPHRRRWRRISQLSLMQVVSRSPGDYNEL